VPPSQSYLCLRWDKADINSYYDYTRNQLQPVLLKIENAIQLRESFSANGIDQIYDDIVSVLTTGAKLYVPTGHKNFYKFWWNEELSALKEAAVSSNQLWKAVGKPRQGPIFDKRQLCKARYRKSLRDVQKLNTVSYTYDLHEALLAKDGPTFWRCWRSKFNSRLDCKQVGGCVDPELIANNFAH